jgi:hypothetical protein
MQLILILALILATSAPALTSWSLAQQPTEARAEPVLDKRIRAANRSRYRAVRDEREWRNPHLLASGLGFELHSLSVPKPKQVALSELRRVLAGLPISDWPYGRVVVVQSPSIVPVDDESRAALQRNIDGALDVCKALGADWWGWPA